MGSLDRRDSSRRPLTPTTANRRDTSDLGQPYHRNFSESVSMTSNRGQQRETMTSAPWAIKSTDDFRLLRGHAGDCAGKMLKLQWSFLQILLWQSFYTSKVDCGNARPVAAASCAVNLQYVPDNQTQSWHLQSGFPVIDDNRTRKYAPENQGSATATEAWLLSKLPLETLRL